MKVLIKNIKGLVQAGENIPSLISGKKMKDVAIINDAFLALENGEVVAYGPMSDWEGISDWRDLEIIDGSGSYVFPSFVDAHTHTVFAKTREEEFVDRIKGLSYEEIALKGGGILNSARKLQEMSEDELFLASQSRINKIIAAGTGALEIKSGYGLSLEGELKMLRVIKRLKASNSIPIKATFLGAHAFPLEFKSNHRGYIDLIIKKMLPIIAEENLADYIDVFCERNYFSVEEMKEILEAGRQFGLQPKVHVNQFSVLGGVKEAIACGALTVDHLEELAEEDVQALKSSSCIPVLLPGCSHFLSIPYANARKLMENDIPVALASDFNPGSTPSYNLFQIWSLACIKMKMTPEEAFNALTVNAAYALGISESFGKIFVGYRGGIILTNEIPSFSYLPYSFGENHIQRILNL